VAATARRNVVPILIEGLKRLEYRGYDSAGLAVVGGTLRRLRSTGRVAKLGALVDERNFAGSIGIAHTRWATHGAPTVANAHPHTQGRVTLVHNGIIENYAEIRERLAKGGRIFTSDTDTEVIAGLLDSELAAGRPPVEALKATLDQLMGAFALAVLVDGEDDLVMGARRGSPLVVGYGDGEMFLGSDALAVGPFTNRVCYLEEGDYVAIDHRAARIFDAAGHPAERAIRVVLTNYLNAHPNSRPGARVRVARVLDRGKARVSVVGVAALVGANRSDAKARASRANGRLGGRPPKTATTRTTRSKASR